MDGTGNRVPVYLAGPFTKPHPAENVRRMVEVFHRCMNAGGMAPMVPHFYYFAELFKPLPYEAMMEVDEVMLRGCRAMLLVSGESPGAEREKRIALFDMHIPIFKYETEFENLCAFVDAVRAGVM